MMRRGFTLIEMVIALAIASVLFAGVVYSVGAITGARAKEGAAELAGVIRSLYDTAALSGKTCRLVFELPPDRESDRSVTYRAECAKSGVTAGAKREEELKAANAKEEAQARLKDDSRFKQLNSDQAPSIQELSAREQQRVDDAAKFSSFQSEDVPTKTLPSNVRIHVWTAKQKTMVKNGTAYLYFFPQGFTEKAQIYVRQGDNVWTLTVSSLTGKTVIYSSELEAPRS